MDYNVKQLNCILINYICKTIKLYFKIIFFEYIYKTNFHINYMYNMYSNNSFLNKWLIQNKYRTDPKDGTKMSHLLLNGGKLFIPQEQHKQFLKLYSKDIILGNNQYISEVRTDIFKYYVDIDFYDYHELSIEQIRELTRDIQNAIKPFIEEQLDTYKRRVLVCVCNESSKKEENGKVYIKTGLHLHWPDIYLNSQQAMIFRSAILQYLENKNGPREDNPWEEIIDESVYKGSGLRMKGSRKAKPCKACKGKRGKKEECLQCLATGKVDEGRVYSLKFILDGFNNEEMKLYKELKNNFYNIVKETSIKTFEDKPNIELKNYPEWFDMSKFKSKKSKKKKTKNNYIKSPVERFEEHSEFGFRKKLSQDDKRYIELLTFLNIWLPKEYNGPLEQVELYYCGDKKPFYVMNTRNHYCMNKGDEHGSNHIYFYINQEEILQKCFSDKLGENNETKCCDFSYKIVKLTDKLKRLLYPEKFEDMEYSKYKLKTNKLIKGLKMQKKVIEYKKYCSYLDIIDKRIQQKKKKLKL